MESPKDIDLAAGRMAEISAAANVERTKVLSLRSPVKSPVNGEMIDALDLREPTVSEWLFASQQTGMESEVHLLSVVAKVSPLTVKQMAISDFVEARDFLLSFARSTRQDGQP